MLLLLTMAVALVIVVGVVPFADPPVQSSVPIDETSELVDS